MHTRHVLTLLLVLGLCLGAANVPENLLLTPTDLSCDDQYVRTSGRIWYNTADKVFRGCANGAAVEMSGAHVPSGMILLRLSACPADYTEVGSLSGQFVRGTTAAAGDVTTTGGADNVTPSGTVSQPTFAGDVLATHSHGTGTLANSSDSAGTPAGTNSTSATTGNCAATNIAEGAGALTACKATAPNLTVSAQTFTGSALAGHTHTLSGSTQAVSAWTPSGTVSQPTFTGNSQDNRPAFTRVIFCQKT